MAPVSGARGGGLLDCEMQDERHAEWRREVAISEDRKESQ